MDGKATAKIMDRMLGWLLTQMATPHIASNGIYEVFRLDTQSRGDHVRPDCNAEAARAISLFLQAFQPRDPALCRTLLDNLVNWLLSVQTKTHTAYRGVFPFYLVDGLYHDDSLSDYVYQNDNGKILVCLLDLHRQMDATPQTKYRLLQSACSLADFWAGLQTEQGLFYNENLVCLQAAHKGPCFVLWLALGMLILGRETCNQRYARCAELSFQYTDSLILSNGRIRTTYEVEAGEAWRPPSSECAIALYCYARAFEETKDEKYLRTAIRIGRFLLTLQHESGGIRNGSEQTQQASLQNDNAICDLVYTQGYALMGLAYLAKWEPDFMPAAHRLAEFLASIQCQGESPLWDGAWRGSYSVDERAWSGFATQENDLDEGGMLSVYTGWCCMPIAEGLMRAVMLAKP